MRITFGCPRHYYTVLTVLALLVLLLNAGKSWWFSKEREIAEQAVVQFHNEFNSGKYQEIYEKGDFVIRKGQSQSDVLAYFNSVHQRLGEFKTSTRVESDVNKSGTETVAKLQYDTEFTKGKAHEQFTFVIIGGEPILHMYCLTSPLMPSK